MADGSRTNGTSDEGPSLEMPSFSRRRRGRDPETPPEVAPRTPATTAAPPPEAAHDSGADADPGAAPVRPARIRRPRPTVALAGLPAAAATGVVVGALGVLLVWLAGVGCEAVRGTSACGGGPGFLILVVVLVLLAISGGWLLTRFGESEGGSTSLLAVGIMAVLVMVFLLDSLDELWAAIAVPVTAVVGYCASWWVTHAVVGDDERHEVAESHDVR